MKVAIKYGFPLLFSFFVIAFGWQTYQLAINVLSDPTVTFLTVFSIDGMAFVYFVGDHFYRKENGDTAFRNQESHQIMQVMYITCLALSFVCTIVYMELWLHHFNWQNVPSFLTDIVEWVLPLLFGIHSIVFYRIFHNEHMAKLAMQVHPLLAPPAPRINAPRQHVAPITSVTRVPDTQKLQSVATVAPADTLIHDAEEEEEEPIDEYDWQARAEKVVIQTGSNVHEPGCKCVGCRPDLHRRTSTRGRPSLRRK